MKFKIFFLALVSAFVLSACDKKEAAAPATPPASTMTQQAAPVAEATPAETEAAEAEVADAEPVAASVAECDEYFDKVMSCYETKVPEAARSALVDAMNQAKASWVAENDEEKAALAESCKQMLEASKASLQAYGCTF